MPKFVLARVSINETGHEEYHFSGKPYVHRSLKGAEQQARHLARQHEAEFGIFQKVATAGLVDETPESAPSTAIAAALAAAKSK